MGRIWNGVQGWPCGFLAEKAMGKMDSAICFSAWKCHSRDMRTWWLMEKYPIVYLQMYRQENTVAVWDRGELPAGGRWKNICEIFHHTVERAKDSCQILGSTSRN